jgi:hypothetical protein
MAEVRSAMTGSESTELDPVTLDRGPTGKRENRGRWVSGVPCNPDAWSRTPSAPAAAALPLETAAASSLLPAVVVFGWHARRCEHSYSWAAWPASFCTMTPHDNAMTRIRGRVHKPPGVAFNIWQEA